MTGADDLAFCHRLCAADEAAWREFLGTYRHGLRCIAHELGCVHEFDDLFASFVIKLLGGTASAGILQQFDGRARLVTFLSIAFRHHVIDHQRAARAHEPLECDPIDHTQHSPLDCAAARDEEAALINALAQLSPHQRHLIDLHYYQGLSLRTIAEMLGRSKSAIARELSAVLAMLQKIMTPNGTTST